MGPLMFDICEAVYRHISGVYDYPGDASLAVYALTQTAEMFERDAATGFCQNETNYRRAVAKASKEVDRLTRRGISLCELL